MQSLFYRPFCISRTCITDSTKRGASKSKRELAEEAETRKEQEIAETTPDSGRRRINKIIDTDSVDRSRKRSNLEERPAIGTFFYFIFIISVILLPFFRYRYFNFLFLLNSAVESGLRIKIKHNVSSDDSMKGCRFYI